MAITVSLGNLDSGRSIQAQYAPMELKESHGATYQKLQVLGLSHQILQFTSGENSSVTLELEFNQLVEPSVSIDEQRRFLLSLVAPSRQAQDVSSGAPARVLFVWPNLFSLTCRLTKLDITHSHFNPDGSSAMFKASLTLEEARVSRLYAEDVVAHGTIRSA